MRFQKITDLKFAPKKSNISHKKTKDFAQKKFEMRRKSNSGRITLYKYDYQVCAITFPRDIATISVSHPNFTIFL
jgi:hypothetical protein